ncbi:MAG: energy transducer TonB [Bacteroidota bacterium]
MLPFLLLSLSATAQSLPIFKIVEEMPQFMDCGNIKVLSRSLCFQEYLCANLIYPAFAKKHGVAGEVIVSFVIDTDGKVKDAQIEQNIGADCGSATLDFVNQMPNWTAGKQRGIKVPVQYRLKVDYRTYESTCR